jgi:hypothetical protein
MMAPEIPWQSITMCDEHQLRRARPPVWGVAEVAACARMYHGVAEFIDLLGTGLVVGFSV